MNTMSYICLIFVEAEVNSILWLPKRIPNYKFWESFYFLGTIRLGKGVSPFEKPTTD
jgi:phage anti-repressor protein